MKTDDIFSTPLKRVEDFKFDKKVVSVFPDMIRRSVPGYENVINNERAFRRTFRSTEQQCI